MQTRLGESVLVEMTLEHHSLSEVLADLSAIWRSTRRSLDKCIFSNETVQIGINKKYVFARIEYAPPESKTFMLRYKTRILPTLLVLNPDGKALRELPIATEPTEFIPFL